MKIFLTKFHYQKKFSITTIFLFVMLCLPTLFYFFITNLRNYLYDKKILKSYEEKEAFVVSVGNLTTGGTGKTPLVIKLGNYFANVKNEKTAIILRGYGGKLDNKKINLIKNDGKIFYNANVCGDEAFLIAKSTLDNCIVITSKNRVEAIKYASSQLNCKIIILDDCFQHRKVKPNLNLLLIDSQKQFGNGFVLPFGPLREEKKLIKKRADKIIVVNKEKNTSQNIEMLIDKYKEKYNKPTFECDMDFSKIYLLNDEKQNDISNNVKSVFAFSAIGSPNQFYQNCEKYNLVGVKSYPDHHLYLQSDVDELNNLAKKQNANMLITTEKDGVKLTSFNSDLKICILKIEPEVDIEKLLKLM